MFVMRLLRPGIPLPGSEPRTPMTFVSVPYSEFLSRINSNQSSFKNRSPCTTKRIVYTTTRPTDIKTPYEKMPDNQVEFGFPDKLSCRFLNSALIALFYVAVLAGLLQQFPVSFTQHAASQIGNRKYRGSGGAKVSEQGETITFAEVAGVDEAKKLEEIVEFLRNPDKYIRVGAHPPRGVLLYDFVYHFILPMGLPGTGKTLLAKAVAVEADVPFIGCSTSEFVELYVGRVPLVCEIYLHEQRRAPSIIFIDEIDVVAKSHDGRCRIVSNDEREQTLNQFLTECQECHCFAPPRRRH
ncbi:hypothetical protein QYF36_008371 [Acer negundo]|nr:hypothetical protein QYF36_008371 [Acer negundo]